jgi:hypothetical protein
MTTRTSSEVVTFQHPFKLVQIKGIQPAGDYKVDMDEEQIEGLSFVAYKRVLTIIHLHSKTTDETLTRALTIKASELEKLLENDKAAKADILNNLEIEHKL